MAGRGLLRRDRFSKKGRPGGNRSGQLTRAVREAEGSISTVMFRDRAIVARLGQVDSLVEYLAWQDVVPACRMPDPLERKKCIRRIVDRLLEVGVIVPLEPLGFGVQYAEKAA